MSSTRLASPFLRQSSSTSDDATTATRGARDRTIEGVSISHASLRQVGGRRSQMQTSEPETKKRLNRGCRHQRGDGATVSLGCRD